MSTGCGGGQAAPKRTRENLRPACGPIRGGRCAASWNGQGGKARASTKSGAREYKVRRAGRRGYVWVQEADLPEVVIKACELLKEQ
jgi:hypothetical protein